jgi:DNA ligase-1
MKYSELVEVYRKLEATSKRLEKTHHLSEFLKKTGASDIEEVMLLLTGRVFPAWDERKIGVASRMMIKALAKATGDSPDSVERSWKKTGDLGDTAELLISKKKQRTLFSSELTVSKVFNNIQKLAEMTGEGTVEKKVQLIAELLTSAKPIEAKYITRTVLEELRVGLGDGTIRDAIVWAFFSKEIGLKYDEKENDLVLPENSREVFNKYINLVQSAYDVANDFSAVAKTIREKGEKGLEKTGLTAGRPVKVMLAQKVKDVKEGFETVGKPAALEFKYDGVRMQIHRKGDKIVVYTRRLEEVTKQFPEVVNYVRSNVKSKDFILDSEAVGFDPKTGKYLPFQKISQRVKRKYDIEKMAKDFPVEVNIFDIIQYEGESMINKPFNERRKVIEKIVNPEKRKIQCAEQITTSDEKKAQEFYKKSLAAGNEGVMMKNLAAPYKPGSRVGHMIKLKPVMKELDLVIVGAEWGTGKRSEWLSSFVLACRDEETGEFLEIGKVGTGIKEKKEEGVSFDELTEMIKPLVTSEKGKEVRIKPEIVIEVTYEEIQKSPSYSSGYALRFPRLSRLRDDRAPEECSSLEMVKDFYRKQ